MSSANAAGMIAPLRSGTMPLERFDAALSWFGTGTVCLALLSFVTALKPFFFGLWFQTEPNIVALDVIGAAAALGLAAMALRRFPVCETVRSPTVLIPGALALLTVVTAVTQTFPMRSWLGAPQIGEGGAEYLCLALFAAQTRLAWPFRARRLALLGTATAAIVAVTILNLIFRVSMGQPESPWVPQRWPDYAAFMAFFWMIALLGSGARRTVARLAIVLVLAGAAIILSNSKTGMILFFLGLPVIGAVCWYGKRRGGGRFIRVIAAALVCIIPVLSIVGYHVADRIQADHPFGQPGESARSRDLLDRVGLNILLTHPRFLVTGAGWGSYSDLLLADPFVGDASLFRETTREPNWEALNAGAFHSHNSALEAVIAAGLLGGILYLALATSMVLRCPGRRVVGVATLWILLEALLSSWFILPMIVPFFAVGLAVSLPRGRSRGTPAGALYAAGSFIIALILGGTAWIEWHDAAMGQNVVEGIEGKHPVAADAAVLLGRDGGRGGEHLWWVAIQFNDYLIRKVNSGRPLDAGDASVYDFVLGAVGQTVADGRAGLRLTAELAYLRSDLIAAYGTYGLDRLRERELSHWGQSIEAVLDHLPLRSDLAVPYFQWLATVGDRQEIQRFSGRLLDRRPDDPVGLWYGGLVLLGPDPISNATGLHLMRRALELGCARLLPVPPALRDVALAGRGAG